VYSLNPEYSAGPTTVSTVVITKRPLPLDSAVPLQSQLLVSSLPGVPVRTGQEAGSPFETLHSKIRFEVSPYFEWCTRGDGDQSVRRGKGMHDEAKTGSPLCERLFTRVRHSFDKEKDCRT
jgi:hypothetical protein